MLLPGDTRRTIMTTTAPQVTPDMVEAAIASEHYFTGADGFVGAIARKVEDGHVIGMTEDQALAVIDGPLSGVQFCILVLKNGHLVTGEALLQDLSKPDPERARASARRRAFDKAYDMVVYAERERLAASAPAAIKWTVLEESLPSTFPTYRGDFLVTVETDGGREVHTLEYRAGQWVHDGEYTFEHSYLFRPVAWAPRPVAYAGEVSE